MEDRLPIRWRQMEETIEGGEFSALTTPWIILLLSLALTLSLVHSLNASGPSD